MTMTLRRGVNKMEIKRTDVVNRVVYNIYCNFWLKIDENQKKISVLYRINSVRTVTVQNSKRPMDTSFVEIFVTFWKKKIISLIIR